MKVLNEIFYIFLYEVLILTSHISVDTLHMSPSTTIMTDVPLAHEKEL